MKTLSLDAVRGLMIAAQGLHDRPQPRATKKAVRSIIRQMHVLQIDTINVIARSPYLVLWSRLGAYDPRWLDDLLAKGYLFEYWSHAACFLPIEDFAYYWLAMIQRGGDNDWGRWIKSHPEVMERVLNYVRENGETRSSDFERTDGKKGGWWNHKDEKIALDALYNRGD